MPTQKDRVIAYGKDRYGATPDHTFAQHPDYAVLRHKDSDKWFALLMTVPRDKLGLNGDGEIEILDVKCDPDEIGSLRQKPGYLPAYHMNKEHWLTVLLDGTVPIDDVRERIDASHALTE